MYLGKGTVFFLRSSAATIVAVHPEEMGGLYPSVPDGGQPPPPVAEPVEMQMPNPGSAADDMEGNNQPAGEYAIAEPAGEIAEEDMQAPPGLFTNNRGNLKVTVSGSGIAPALVSLTLSAMLLFGVICHIESCFSP